MRRFILVENLRSFGGSLGLYLSCMLLVERAKILFQSLAVEFVSGLRQCARCSLQASDRRGLSCRIQIF